MPTPLVLVPPSEGKAIGGRRSAGRDNFATTLRTPRNEVRTALAAELHSRRGTALERLLGARGELLAHALKADLELCEGRPLVLPAHERFTGVVWEHLAPSTLAVDHLERLLVPNALYGLSRGTDPIAEFRLSMSVSLGGLGVVASFWRPHVTDRLATLGRDRLIVDLLPGEHAASIDFDRLANEVEVMRVRFVTAEGAKAAGHGAKAVKGVFARRLLERGTDRISSFRWEGWKARKVGSDVEVLAPPPPASGARR